MQRDMGGLRFHDVEGVREGTRGELSATGTDDFEGCFEECNRGLDKCNGEYFEGDRVVL